MISGSRIMMIWKVMSMIKLLGPDNDLRSEDGRITKWGYLVAVLSTLFGLACFLTGRSLYGKHHRGKQK